LNKWIIWTMIIVLYPLSVLSRNYWLPLSKEIEVWSYCCLPLNMNVCLRKVWRYQRGIGILKSMKDRQYKGQKKKDKQRFYKALHRKLKIKLTFIIFLGSMFRIFISLLRSSGIYTGLLLSVCPSATLSCTIFLSN